MQEDERLVLTDESIRQQIMQEHKPNLNRCIFCFIIFVVGFLVLYAIKLDEYTFVMVSRSISNRTRFRTINKALYCNEKTSPIF